MSEAFTPRSSAALVVGALLVTVAACGCNLMRRGPVAENVMAARQLSLRGIDAMQQGRWSEAEVLLAQAIKQCPVDERAHCCYAEVLWRRGAHSQAIAHMEEAVRLSGGSPELLVQLGEMYLARGQIEGAHQRAARALAANYELPSAWALRGDILSQQRRYEEALACYHRALGYEPRYPRVQLALARTYQQQGRLPQALLALDALKHQYTPDQVPIEVLQLQGIVLKDLGRHQDAVEHLAAAARRETPSPELLYHLSQAHLLAGDTPSARLAVLQALEIAPEHQPSLELKTVLDRQQQGLSASVLR